MAHALEGVFRELGLSHYLDTFVDQGFDTWDTILDIQESDLDALGVKLGHRRKLQRRIANARGIAPSVSLASSVKAASDDGKDEAPRSDSSRAEPSHESGGVTKRKYRRHPKNDDNAPARPPSAYVLFSNKMREDLKSQNLTFTELAKLVGEHWQSLPPAEKESYEKQANTAKEKYHRDMLEYKKTPEYRQYAQYLQEFKEKQARQSQAHDAAKRLKLDPPRLRHGSSSGSSVAAGGAHGTTSSTGSGSEGTHGSEPLLTRQERASSIASLANSQMSSTAPTPLYRHGGHDATSSPRLAHFDSSSSADMSHKHHRQGSWRDAREGEPATQALPRLSDVLDDRRTRRPGIPDYKSGFVAANHSPPHMPGPPRAVPFLSHDSSSGSTGSTSSSSSFPRTPGDGPLPIHALLTSGNSTYEKLPPARSASLSRGPDRANPYGAYTGPTGYGLQHSAFHNMKTERSGDGDVVMTSGVDIPPRRSDKAKDSFDGMSALLKAGEIVGRGHGD